MSTKFIICDNLVKKWCPPLSEKLGPIATVIVGMYFEGIGVLLRRKLVNVKLVQHLFFLPVKVTWEKMKPVIEGVRKQFNLPTTFASFEYLYNEMQKREQPLQPA